MNIIILFYFGFENRTSRLSGQSERAGLLARRDFYSARDLIVRIESFFVRVDTLQYSIWWQNNNLKWGFSTNIANDAKKIKKSANKCFS